MKKEERNKGVTLATLVITIVVLLILSGITINYGVSNIKRAKIQNIKTNMLLIEAKTKEYVENANYDLGIKPNEATAEMKEKAISELEGEGKGTKVTTSSSISTELNIMGITSEEISNGNVYQISTTDLEKMGIKGVESSEKKGWYIVVYDITNSNVKIYNTKGHSVHDSEACSALNLLCDRLKIKPMHRNKLGGGTGEMLK